MTASIKQNTADQNIGRQDMATSAPRDFVSLARRLGEVFERRAAEADETDAFVIENYADLKAAGFMEAAVPIELGGGGCDLPTLAGALRELAKHCGSTALALSMHTHQVAIPAWRWRHHEAPVHALLERVAAERLVLLSSGGSDWIAGAGTAERVPEGYRITARKTFVSGAPAGDLLMTAAVSHSETDSPMVLHFEVPMTSPHVRIVPTWRTLGMCATGSHDVSIDGYIVPDAAIVLKRRAGEWHPMLHINMMIAMPLVYSVYLGVAEGARDIAIALAKKRRLDQHVTAAAGRMDTELRAAQIAHAALLEVAARNDPGPVTTNEVMIGRSLVGRHAIATVELAMEVAGGPGFYRAQGLERRFRDIQAARYHALQAGPQATYAGTMALGGLIDKVF
jgi:alkylation response protein AidB-like acyl-CoA dehydrogenase